jgi:4-amino-4-deoxy-L-arabinose transferase-like glycosyltransferase
MKQLVNPLHYLIIILVGSILFLPFLGHVHLFDWDEINFAESAREMMVSGNYSKVQINFQGFWEKPPLFIWMQVLSMKVFGVNEFAARFPNALFGILTLCLIYRTGKKNFKGHIAHWWVLCYLGAITPHLYFKTGLIDPVFNFFIFLGILQFFEAFKNHSQAYNSNRHFLVAGVYTGIAILCKGPVALLVSLLVLLSMVFAKRMVWFFNIANIFLYLLITGLVSSIWFAPETIQNGPYFIVSFIQYQIELFSQNVAGHQQPFYYHPLVLLIGCFPVSIIALAVWKRNEYYTYNENLFRTVMQCLFWVVLILFSIVKTKIVHYSSLCWLPLTFLGAYSIESVYQGVYRFKWQFELYIVLMGILISSAFIAFPLIMKYKRSILLDLIHDDFSKQNFSAIVDWQVYDTIPGFLLLITVVVFIFFWNKNKVVALFGSLLVGNLLVIFTASILITPKIEQHTQAAAVNFFKSKENEKCYIFITGYKSYASYFYAKVKPLRYNDDLNLLNEKFIRSKGKKSFLALTDLEKEEYDDNQKFWLLHGRVDRPVYFIAKTDDREGLEKETSIIELWDKNGFVVYQRK